MMRPCVLLLLFFGVLASGQLLAQERILSYHSELALAQDGSMDVVETIRVRAEGEQIQRGIFRDFPTNYRDHNNLRVVVGFRVVSVLRDGRQEPFREERGGNGVRVYIGDADVFLRPGEYEYVIHYRTNRQLGFFADHDELYWNVTGNGWAFDIEQASARVTLPQAVPQSYLHMEGYTGPEGSKAQDYRSTTDAGSGYIETTLPLSSFEGLTLVFTFPKGIVDEPTAQQRAVQTATDNLGALLGVLAVLGSAAYLFRVWSRHGKDPEPGVIFPHYSAPAGYSPAAARYIRRMCYDNLCFTAALVNLAVNGHVLIKALEEKPGLFSLVSGATWEIHRTSSRHTVSTGEKVLLESLFSKGPVVTLEQSNQELLQQAISAHQTSLYRDYAGKYFNTNMLKLLPSFLGTIGVVVLAVLLQAFSPLLVVALVLIVIMHIVFVFLMPAPSARGRDLLDKLEGFKDFLEVSEKDELKLKHPPRLTPELFEKFLPFAIALDVEQAWAKRFTRVFAALEQQTGSAYQPHWYGGAFHYTQIGAFTTAVSSSFSSAISSAATPPGSSSGSGGGGSSGGGGGGGGGGGW